MAIGLMIASNLPELAFKEYRTPKCSVCHVIVKADAAICPRCKSIFMRD